MPSPQFQAYIGIDYSGAETSESSLKGIRVYVAQRDTNPIEVHPPPNAKNQKYWTRRGLAAWLTKQILDGPPALVGIDHGFSFPLDYFTKHELAHDWDVFLDDFQQHWPTDAWNNYVDFIRDGMTGNGAARTGDPKWLRLTERWTSSASSVFRFDVQGSVGKSTHAGLPWLRYVRRKVEERCFFWPFDGWEVPAGKSCMVEVYPSIFAKRYPREDRESHQQDAYAVASWLRRVDDEGSLQSSLKPSLNTEERRMAKIEGWILGVM